MQESEQAFLVLLFTAVTSDGLLWVSFFFELTVYPLKPLFVSQVATQTLVRILLADPQVCDDRN